MEPWAGNTDEKRRMKQGKGSIAAKRSSSVCLGGEHELFGHMAILWPRGKAGHANHACELTQTWFPGSAYRDSVWGRQG